MDVISVQIDRYKIQDFNNNNNNDYLQGEETLSLAALLK